MISGETRMDFFAGLMNGGGTIFASPRVLGRGRIASQDEIRVRGSLRESYYHLSRGGSPSPQPSPRRRGEEEDAASVFAHDGPQLLV
ncbi:hypothetical protein CWO91_18860 [Bradyrhizobium genosp. SA-3]|nr:hypothetical protein CWO91_18860 [Bradyrhizobium genosp. SA-3]